MIKRNTVVVVGAGCSKEFGLPLGAELRDDILEIASTAILNGSLSAFGEQLLRSGLDNINRNLEDRLRQFYRGLFTRPSIDQYLDFHQENETLVGIGKITLAQAILDAEITSKLSQDSLKAGMSHLSGTWLSKLFEVMCDGTSPSSIERIFDNIIFICFNYDRCIESYFFWAVLYLTHWTPAQAVDLVVNRLKIYHPYGTIGGLNWEGARSNPEALSMGRRRGLEDMVRAAPSRIRTFSEGISDKGELEKIHAALDQSERTLFLGFSYLEQNMQLLGFDRAEEPDRDCLATILGIQNPDIQWSINSIISVAGTKSVSRFNGTASALMENYGNSLRRS